MVCVFCSNLCHCNTIYLELLIKQLLLLQNLFICGIRLSFKKYDICIALETGEYLDT